MQKLIRTIIYIFALIGFVLIVGYISIKLGLTKSAGIIDSQHDYFQNQIRNDSWINTEEWIILKEAIKKDLQIINKVSEETGVPSRIIITPLVVEQLRLFNSEREIFKQIFAPLKILGTQSQFSWGVMGVKQDTAIQIENNLKNIHSPWYLGAKYANILDFKTNNHNEERFNRLTDENDRYYSYLYGAIYIKQIINQWKLSGYDISDKPGIIATLYNIGFINSHPKVDPQIGGAEITINKTTYSFGGLAQSFYYSDELIEEFIR